MDMRNRILHAAIGSTHCLLILFVLATLLLQETKSIHLEHVEIPGVVGVGESPTLVCDVDLEPDELYSVKWYKDNDEFYRFMPKSEPTTQIYPVEGILVDKTRSSGETVVLRSVTPATGGFFRCEVSGEAPSFASVTDGGHLLVVIPPKHKPEIFGGVVDDTIELNCTTDGSRPAADIKWFVNGVQVRSELIEASNVRRSSNGLETSFSVLALSSKNAEYFPHAGPVTIACQAVIPTPVPSDDVQRDQSVVFFHRRVASQATVAGKQQSVGVRSRLHANNHLVSNLIMRKEIIVYVNGVAGEKSSEGGSPTPSSLLLLFLIVGVSSLS